MKIDLSDTTFIIPVRIDSIIRLENLLLTIRNIGLHFFTNIFIIESSPYNNGIIRKLLNNKITYIYVKDNDPIFHRTKIINNIVKKIKSKIIGVWDSDIIIDYKQILDAVEHIRNDNYQISFPYDGHFYDISFILRKYYIIHRNLSFLQKNINKMNLIYSSENRANAVGGAFLVSTNEYKESGMENIDFYGWGIEDGERYFRWTNLGYKIYRSKGNLFHLTHPRGINSKIRSEYHQSNSENYLFKTLSQTKQEIINNTLVKEDSCDKSILFL
jgi:hypothetical protein